LKALFPRLEIELDDWTRLLPPAECCWAALEYRELYPSDKLLPVAVKTLQGAQDRVVLANGVNLERWRGLLADDSTCVLVFDVDPNEIPERIAGYRTLTVRGNKIPKFDFEVIEGTKLSHRPVVFISYANIYRDYAQRLTNALQQDCEVLSDLELQAGDRWIRKLADMLERADAVIALAGDATAGRSYPMEEMHLTINLGKLLVPVFVNRFTEPRELLERFCANTDATGKIVYLSDCRGKELDWAIAMTAGNIVKAIAQTTNRVETVIQLDESSGLGERIQKVLAREYGVSRREAERWIVAARVKVNGNIVQLGARLKSGDQLQVDDRIVDWEAAGKQDTRVLLYHKPIGELVTRQDSENRPLIFSNLPKLEKGQWSSVMRLDMNTSGIVLVTNDGVLANQLMQSAKQIECEYAVRVRGEISEAILERLKKGVELENGMGRFDEINFTGGKGVNKWYRVIIKETDNCSVRGLLESQQIQVSRLILVRYGAIKLPESLKTQSYQELIGKELELLCQLVGYAEERSALNKNNDF
ncbi:MAG: pseudouridine synthase, partial [Methylobacter sp.]